MKHIYGTYVMLLNFQNHSLVSNCGGRWALPNFLWHVYIELESSLWTIFPPPSSEYVTGKRSSGTAWSHGNYFFSNNICMTDIWQITCAPARWKAIPNQGSEWQLKLNAPHPLLFPLFSNCFPYSDPNPGGCVRYTAPTVWVRIGESRWSSR